MIKPIEIGNVLIDLDNCVTFVKYGVIVKNEAIN